MRSAKHGIINNGDKTGQVVKLPAQFSSAFAHSLKPTISPAKRHNHTQELCRNIHYAQIKWILPSTKSKHDTHTLYVYICIVLQKAHD